LGLLCNKDGGKEKKDNGHARNKNAGAARAPANIQNTKEDITNEASAFLSRLWPQSNDFIDVDFLH
jgi:hypothetical protein